MSPTELGMFISFGFTAGAALFAFFGPLSNSETAVKSLLAIMVIGAIGFVVLAFLDVKNLNEAKRAALDTIEDTHSITIDVAGHYSRRPTDWMIDGVWRECYLSDKNLDHAASADLMCETPINGQAPYTKIGPAE